MSNYNFFNNFKTNLANQQAQQTQPQEQPQFTQADLDAVAEESAVAGAQQEGRKIAQEAISPKNQQNIRAKYKQGIVQSIPLSAGGKQ